MSRWHRVDATEVWHWYAGAPLALDVADAKGTRRLTLGVDLAAGERPQAVVPVHAWQRAQSQGAWTLVGCTVAPGFEFARFELAPWDLIPRPRRNERWSKVYRRLRVARAPLHRLSTFCPPRILVPTRWVASVFAVRVAAPPACACGANPTRMNWHAANECGPCDSRVTKTTLRRLGVVPYEEGSRRAVPKRGFRGLRQHLPVAEAQERGGAPSASPRTPAPGCMRSSPAA